MQSHPVGPPPPVLVSSASSSNGVGVSISHLPPPSASRSNSLPTSTRPPVNLPPPGSISPTTTSSTSVQFLATPRPATSNATGTSNVNDNSHSRPTSAPSTTTNANVPNNVPIRPSTTGGGPAAPVTSTALAAAAASTSASLFNLNELFDTVKMMSCGRVFTGYFANPSLAEPIKQDLFVFFDCSPIPATPVAPAPASTSASSSTATPQSQAQAQAQAQASVAKKPTPMIVPPTPNRALMHLGGALYWSVVGRDGSLHRTRAADLSLALSEIDDIYLGKRTTAFTLPFASQAKEECCFSLIAKNRTHMNFEAKNPVLLVSWLLGLKRLVQANKKLLEPSPINPPSNAIGGSLDIHDTNQSSLKHDIWQTVLAGIQAGTQVFANTLATAQLQQQQKMSNQQSPANQPVRPLSATPTAQQQPITQHPPPPSSSLSAAPSSASASSSSSSTPSTLTPAPAPSSAPATSSGSSGGFLSNLLRRTSSPPPVSAPTTPSKQPIQAKPNPSSTPAPASTTGQPSNPTNPHHQRRLSITTTSTSNMPAAYGDVDGDDGDDGPIDPLQIFQILGRVGQGNYGYVYKARDTRDESLVAIKIIEVDSTYSSSTKELEAEINTLAKCHSKYIVSYRGTFARRNQIWIVMEYCLAGSVSDLMAITDRILNESQIAAILCMSLQGLAYFHSLNHLHRDIKAGNILINHDGIVKLSDFGVSAQLTASISKRQTLLGSPYWMAPEVLTSTSHSGFYNERADIWSLGAVAIELATGDPPYHEIHPMKAIFAIPTLPPPRLPATYGDDATPCNWSQPFQDFVAACLCKDPAQRPSAAQLQSHPFVRNMLPHAAAIIKQLVIECMPEIDKYREIEARMANKVAFGTRGRGGGGGDSDSEYSVSRSLSSFSRSYDYTYNNSGMRSARSISDLKNLASSQNGRTGGGGGGGGGGGMNSLNNRTARWERELSRSERDRERTRREREWELELSQRRDNEYSQRSHSPSFSTSMYWTSHDRDPDDTPVRRDGRDGPTAFAQRRYTNDGDDSPSSTVRSVSRSHGAARSLRMHHSASAVLSSTPHPNIDDCSPLDGDGDRDGDGAESSPNVALASRLENVAIRLEPNGNKPETPTNNLTPTTNGTTNFGYAKDTRNIFSLNENVPNRPATNESSSSSSTIAPSAANLLRPSQPLNPSSHSVDLSELDQSFESDLDASLYQSNSTDPNRTTTAATSANADGQKLHRKQRIRQKPKSIKEI